MNKMYRVVEKSCDSRMSWETDIEFSPTDFEHAKEIVDIVRRVANKEYDDGTKYEIITDTPIFFVYKITNQREEWWKGMTKMVYIEEVA